MADVFKALRTLYRIYLGQFRSVQNRRGGYDFALSGHVGAVVYTLQTEIVEGETVRGDRTKTLDTKTVEVGFELEISESRLRDLIHKAQYNNDKTSRVGPLTIRLNKEVFDV